MLLNNYRDRCGLLVDWMYRSVSPGASVLDIGANDGMLCRAEVARIAGRFALLAGVDPDVERLEQNSLLDTRFTGTIEQAQIPENSFEVAYAIYVLEHIERPVEFLRAVHRVLRPGGSFFFITPNGYQYFVWAARLLSMFGLQERVLRWVQPSDLVDQYHYHAYYRMNTERKIRRIARQVGFQQMEFLYCEKLDEFASYFPRFLKFFPALWEKAVYLLGREWLLGNLIGRLSKPKSKP